MQQTIDQERRWRSAPWRIATWSIAAALMLIPLSGRLLSGDFGWTGFDFMILAVILLAGCVLFDLAARRAPNLAYLAASGAALASGFGLFVVNGAVGLVGSEDEGANLLFALVILVAIIGAVSARGRADRLSRAMLAAAAAQVLVSAAVLAIVGDADAADMRIEIAGLTLFALLWAASGWLFRRSSRESALAELPPDIS